jgi:hypothetical protein
LRDWFFSAHARERMEARGITEAQVYRVLRCGGRKRTAAGRVLRYIPPEQARYSKRLRALLDVVIVVQEAERLVVTVMREPGRIPPSPPEERRLNQVYDRKAGRWIQRRLHTRFYP